MQNGEGKISITRDSKPSDSEVQQTDEANQEEINFKSNNDKKILIEETKEFTTKGNEQLATRNSIGLNTTEEFVLAIKTEKFNIVKYSKLSLIEINDDTEKNPNISKFISSLKENHGVKDSSIFIY